MLVDVTRSVLKCVLLRPTRRRTSQTQTLIPLFPFGLKDICGGTRVSLMNFTDLSSEKRRELLNLRYTLLVRTGWLSIDTHGSPPCFW